VNLFDNLSLFSGVSKAINNVNQTIAPALVGKNLDLKDQAAIDKILLDLDKTENKCKDLVIPYWYATLLDTKFEKNFCKVARNN